MFQIKSTIRKKLLKLKGSKNILKLNFFFHKYFGEYMKLVIELNNSGGVTETMLCEFDLDGRDSLKNVLSRQEITRSVCEKNIDPKSHSRKSVRVFF